MITLEPTANALGEPQAWTSLIQQRFGIRLASHQMDKLSHGIQTVCQQHQLSGPPELMARLNASQPGSASPELRDLVSAFTVGETYFFRDAVQMRFLREIWLPKQVARCRALGRLRLRIWSAGCSTGEEIYTLAMLVAQAIDDLARWHIELLGTDLNEAALAFAQQGRYRAWALRATPALALQRHFIRQGDDYQLLTDGLPPVSFKPLNLATQEGALAGELAGELAGAGEPEFDLIVCRNVFIYLTPPAINHAMARFAAALRPSGCVMLAAADPAPTNCPQLRSAWAHGVLVYQPQAAGAPPALGPTPWAQIPPLSPTRHSTPPAPAASAPKPRAAQPTAPRPLAWPEAVAQCLASRDWPALLHAVAQAPGLALAQRSYLQALAQAHLGQPAQALAACQTSVQQNPMNAPAQFLLAILYAHLEHGPGAEPALRRTLYLNWQLPEAHYQLALLLIAQNRWREAQHHLDQAEPMITRHDPATACDPALAMSYQDLAALLGQAREALQPHLAKAA